MNRNPREFLIVLTNLPDKEMAVKLARTLVEKRLAACVNVIDGCTSVYRWKGAIETEREVPVVIKTRTDLLPALERELLARHPYDVPEIVAVALETGYVRYLDWIAGETLPAAELSGREPD